MRADGGKSKGQTLNGLRGCVRKRRVDVSMNKSVSNSTLPLRTCGRRSAPPVLLLHGFLGSSADLLPVANRLKKDWRCLLPDLPGHGHAHFPKQPEFYSFNGAAQAVLAGVTEPFHLVGY